jgi:hypothetical protein
MNYCGIENGVDSIRKFGYAVDVGGEKSSNNVFLIKLSRFQTNYPPFLRTASDTQRRKRGTKINHLSPRRKSGATPIPYEKLPYDLFYRPDTTSPLAVTCFGDRFKVWRVRLRSTFPGSRMEYDWGKDKI